MVHGKKGFTLIELLVGAAIFLLTTTSFGYILRAGKTSLNAAAQLNQAIYLLQEEMEEIRSLPFDQISLLNGKSFAEEQGKIVVFQALSDLHEITLELKWDPKKAPLCLYSIRSRY